MTSPTFSPERFDELRAAHPELGFALYAYDPGGVVSFEVLTPDGEAFAFKGLTAEAAMAAAFPLDAGLPNAEPQADPAPDEPAGSIFD